MSVPPLPEEFGRVHLVGIGGAGMSGLARLLLGRGAQVSGSDAKDSRRLAALRAAGARVALGHDAGHLGDATAVVYAPAVGDDNVEVVEARCRDLRVASRAVALGLLTADARTLAVAGTHGKTTAAVMATLALQACGEDPSFVVGSDTEEAGAKAHTGTGDLFVVEADEADGAFWHLSPAGTLVTSVESEHLDFYRTAAAVDAAFETFVAKVDVAGFVVACADDPGAARLARLTRERYGDGGPRVTTYGQAAAADVRLEQVRVRADTDSSPYPGHPGHPGHPGYPGVAGRVAAHGVRLGELTLRVPGRHNLLNATGVLAAGLELGLPAGGLMAGLASFGGVRRRFEAKGTVGGVRVVDDYANHPAKVEAVLAAARDVVGGGRVVVAFQPHTYTRTAAFGERLGAALGLADAVVVMDVYAAGEPRLPGVGGAQVAAAVPLPAGAVVYEPSWTAAAELLADLVRPGDLVLTVGAGDVTLLGPELIRVLSDRAASAPGTTGPAGG